MEVIVETAKYYADRATFGNDGKYHILDVIGPDEYNIHANDNYFTNHLVYWNILKAISSMDELEKNDFTTYQKLCTKIEWDDKLKSHLYNVSNNLAFPSTIRHVNEQYQGFFELPDANEIKRDKYNMPLDRSYHYDSGSQVLKQPDVVMMHYLFPDDFVPEVQKKSYEYYERRCNHGSSLSPSIHFVQGLRCGFINQAFNYLLLSTLLDLKNLHLDQNLDEGIHMACAGGSWACAVYGIGGIRVTNGKLHISPVLPPQIEKIKFAFLFQSRLFRINVSRKELKVSLEFGNSLEAIINGVAVLIEQGVDCKFAL